MSTDKRLDRSGSRRAFLKTSGVVMLGATAGCLGDDSDDGDIPGDIRILVHVSEGGGYDTYARLFQSHLEEAVSNNVIVENITGAGGMTAIQELVNSDPDGSTLMLADTQGFAIHQANGENQGWDMTEFTNLAGIAEDVRSLNVNPNSDIDSFDEYIERAQNEELTYGWTGPTSSTALVPIFIGSIGEYYDPELPMEYGVQYDGGSDVRIAMEQGDVDVAGGSWSSNLNEHQEGAINMLLYMGDDDEPPEEISEVDTLRTADVDNAEDIANILTGRRHFVGPPGMDNELTEDLRGTFEDIITSDEFHEDAGEVDRPVDYISGEEFDTFVPDHIALYEDQQELLDSISQ